ncbi:MAG: AMP-binding protein [Gammaproteobacteria bacterium]|nr:AMP-binding protein [Gammaproteobacteria bacterium]
MTDPISQEQLISQGLPQDGVNAFLTRIHQLTTTLSKEAAWQKISKEILTPAHPFKLHLFLFTLLFPDWQNHPELAPVWIPDKRFIPNTNIAKFMSELQITTRSALHAFSVLHFADFWQRIISKLGIIFRKPFTEIVDLKLGVASPQWLVNAKINIVDSCENTPHDKIALIFPDKNAQLHTLTYGELNRLTNKIANSLIAAGYVAKDAIAIDMPMTMEAVAIYLAIIKMGGVVVSIADSFSSDEIATRLHITQTKLVFTQDFILRGSKKLPLYEKVLAANPPSIIVLSAESNMKILLRNTDQQWDHFLGDNDQFTAVACEPMDACNILFSSGTTGEPKAIPWNHTTAIKAASDAYFHQNVQPGDILAWPTNLGWMMGPWLVFAGLINHATIALYPDIPSERAFGEFIQNAKVTMLGVVPTLVAAWKQKNIMQELDWTSIKVFSSTGECSNAEDMLYLSSLAGYKPIIEYCGGTEIGGSYLTSTVIENNYLSVFSTPALGIDLLLLDETGQSSQEGEVALIPPSIGLSTRLLNADHQKIYFANMPTSTDGKILRRHGDQARRLSNGYYCILGRADDTMNLGGIKISSAEIERALVGIDNIIETAAIAMAPLHNGPSQLVIFAATNADLDLEKTHQIMQSKINTKLNPLFKIHDIVFTKELPKTASNKIMRRVLRQQYKEKIGTK